MQWKFTQKLRKPYDENDHETHLCAVSLTRLLSHVQEFIPVKLGGTRIVFLLGIVGRAVVLTEK